ncbi:2,3,4,5-tetrahydropyridine-2,6-dicarboxylate N-succinyltransferase [Roseisolibacter sp. H3M3-2]|uniref:2,3,4,5-tetrahydropyridine-2,6-dicarboxylate N-succinyltransferase n=1 Tax=Roseisolibacter sp. H3M3-2 TaxID=3031323 RepID=UPI0023DA829F|nr:2,3,4,5-tetrahydropyridine-2,6-dicarboxylate N-succinyltransferase [Roseisolibacter sp. H3M3-2]MDF1502051.1 2,3,4,5-tetrahydropyridine-2,6-dicarboxylate N-succinyltransferase [Roseisolibacter sp. H3M3-2]
MIVNLQELERRVLEAADTPPGAPLPTHAATTVEQLLTALEHGDVRAARRGDDGVWHAVPWVKRGILLAFRAGRMVEIEGGGGSHSPFRFFDKHTVPPRALRLESQVRVVPGGSAIRRGTYLAPGVVCMPPMYINVGAWVGGGTMVDSHALVGSCAQIGERVHLSAAAQVGGVLEPVNASPVVIEDEAIVGGNCGVYEGTIVRRRAVLAAGVVLTRGTPVFDLVRETVYRATAERPLEIPEGAVVVPGARQVKGAWAGEQGLSVQTPVIVKYRDEKTDLATALEDWLR